MKLMRKLLPVAIFMVSSAAFAAEDAAASAGAQETGKTIAIAIAAAVTMALSVIGAGSAIGKIGAAALGAAAEKPEILSKSILFLALAEGLAVLGFAISIMLVQKII